VDGVVGLKAKAGVVGRDTAPAGLPFVATAARLNAM